MAYVLNIKLDNVHLIDAAYFNGFVQLCSSVCC